MPANHIVAEWKTPAVEMMIRAMRRAGCKGDAIRQALKEQFGLRLTTGQMNGYLHRSGLTAPLSSRTDGAGALKKLCKPSVHRQEAPEPAVDQQAQAKHDRAMARPAQSVRVVEAPTGTPAVSRRGTQYAGFSMLGGTVRGL